MGCSNAKQNYNLVGFSSEEEDGENFNNVERYKAITTEGLVGEGELSLEHLPILQRRKLEAQMVERTHPWPAYKQEETSFLNLVLFSIPEY